MTALAAAFPRGTTKPATPGKLSLRELTEHALLLQVVAAGALVNAQGDVLYLHGRTGMFLEPAPGEAGISNILRMAREGLRRDLTSTLHKAVGTKDIVSCPGLRVKTNGHFTLVNLTIRPVTSGPAASAEAPLFLVILEEAPVAPPVTMPLADAAGPATPDADGFDKVSAEARIAGLKLELRAKEEYLQTTHEELESSTEELKSSNEEMQSVNEELQSTNEELETSKEELQSVNEELATVNTELQTKVTDLSRANNDMNNLLAGTGIGTVFVDHRLRILRFTPAASKIINLIVSDIGRPVAHLVSNLVGYNRLVADVQEVLATLVTREVDVLTQEGRNYTMRIQPYRTLDNVIEGAVISFVDITAIMRTRDALARTAELLERTGEMAKVGGWELDLRTQQLFWTLETYRIHELDPTVVPTVQQALGFYAPEFRLKIESMIQAATVSGTSWDVELPLTTAKGRSIWARTMGSPVKEGGKTIKLMVAFQDITDRKRGEEALQQADERARRAASAGTAQ